MFKLRLQVIVDKIYLGLRIIVKKSDVDEIFSVEEKASKSETWREIKSDIKDVDDVYIVDIKSVKGRRHDIKIIASKKSESGEKRLFYDAYNLEVLGE